MLGFPEDGPYDVQPARLGQTANVLTQDAYGRGPVQRSITSLRGLVRRGNSGGPVVDGAGRVVATVFAAATGRRRTGYGVPDAVVRDALAAGARARRHGSVCLDRYKWGRACRPLRPARPCRDARRQLRVRPAGPRRRPGGRTLLTERAKRLRCPDLVMRQPYGLYTDRLTYAGHTVLRAGNVIDSVGAGPVELHGTRSARAS